MPNPKTLEGCYYAAGLIVYYLPNKLNKVTIQNSNDILDAIELLESATKELWRMHDQSVELVLAEFEKKHGTVISRQRSGEQ